jgi:hypothetical protein
MARRNFSISEISYALTADAGPIFQIGRHLQEQGIRNVNPGTPARAFVGVDRAKLAII